MMNLIVIERFPDLPDIIEVPVGHSLLPPQLPELVEQDVQLELGLEVAEAAVAETLEGPVGDHGAEVLHVRDEGGQVWNLVVDCLLLLLVLLAGIDGVDALMENRVTDFTLFQEANTQFSTY